MGRWITHKQLTALLVILALLLTLSQMIRFVFQDRYAHGDISSKRQFNIHDITVQQVIPQTNESVDKNTESYNSKSQAGGFLQNILKAKSFNLGQFMRGEKQQNLDGTLKQEIINQLKDQNMCPEQYAFPQDIIKRFAKMEQVSNYSNSQRAKILNNETADSSQQFNKTILILTPVSNYENNIFHYFKLLCSLTYPHDLISVVLGEDSSLDKTYYVSSVHAKQLSPYFRSVSVHHFKDKMPENDFFGKHDEFYQFTRRSHLAKVRNQLLFTGIASVIGDPDFILWLDADVKYVPPDIIQHLLYENKDVIVPSCMFAKSSEEDGLDVYDKNTWQETQNSLAYLKKLKEDQLRLEGYTQTMRKYLPDLKDQGNLVPLDGVGGCVLMVRADCHRKGLVFPPFVFSNHIETEGLAKMAAKMKFGVYGLPHVNVIHW